MNFTNQGENDEFDVEVTRIEGGRKPIKACEDRRHRGARAASAAATLGSKPPDGARGDDQGRGRDGARRGEEGQQHAEYDAALPRLPQRPPDASYPRRRGRPDRSGGHRRPGGGRARARSRCSWRRARAAACAACARRSRRCSASTGSERPRRPRRGLQEAFAALHERVEEVAERLEQRLGVAEARLDGAIAYRALVRYDAYGELSGHQSATLALLDAERNGVVLSSIAHRDTARLYCKQVHDGRGEHLLSPEEDEAIRRALAGERGTARCSRTDARRLPRPGRDQQPRGPVRGPGHRELRAGAAADGPTRSSGGPGRARSSARSCRSRTRARAPSARRSTRSRSSPTTS